MKFEFGKFTDITEHAKKINPEYKDYVRIFICPDVWDFWLIRIQKGYNKDYEKSPDTYLLERDKISMDRKGERLTLGRLNVILKDDDFSNWDIEESDNLEKLIEMVDGGFGIL